jgi:hypothetical protein
MRRESKLSPAVEEAELAREKQRAPPDRRVPLNKVEGQNRTLRPTPKAGSNLPRNSSSYSWVT